MSLNFTNPSTLDLDAYFEAGDLCVDCEGIPLPPEDQSIICELSEASEVVVSLTLDPHDSTSMITASHYDAAGELWQWSGTNPCSHTFGLTGGFVDITITAQAAGQSKITIVKIKIKPKTDKPFRR